MTKSEFIEWLQGIPGDPEVLAWDHSERDWLPVTGGTHDELELKLYTDDRDEDDED